MISSNKLAPLHHLSPLLFLIGLWTRWSPSLHLKMLTKRLARRARWVTSMTLWRVLQVPRGYIRVFKAMKENHTTDTSLIRRRSPNTILFSKLLEHLISNTYLPLLVAHLKELLLLLFAWRHGRLHWANGNT